MRRAACCWMTKLSPERAVGESPLGSAVREKSRIDRYFASLADAAPLAIRCLDASAVPPGRRVACILREDGTRIYRNQRLGLPRLAPASLRRYPCQALARGRIARVQLARDQ